jgi:hypothetical protein
MRVYALLLGITLTAGYGYTADVAVSSLGPGRHALVAPAVAPTPDKGPGAVWYGGVLDPITVEIDGAAPTKRHVLSRPTVRCIESARPTFHAIS